LESNPGCNIWTWGYEPTAKEKILFSGSDKHNGYVEMWGGITHGFKKYYSLDPGKSISWSECMYPYANIKGLHFANNDFAVTFLKTDKETYEVNLCPSGDLKGIELKVISISSKNVYLDVIIKSIFPKKEKAGYIFNVKEKDIELVIFKYGKEIIRLDPKEPIL
jgi:hypothetical protein